MAAGLAGHVLLQLKNNEETSRSLLEQHVVVAYPTFAILNAQGEVVARNIGFGDSADWLQWVAAVAADPLTITERKARFAAQPTCPDAMILGRAAYVQMEPLEAEDYFRRALELDRTMAVQADAPYHWFVTLYRGVGMERVPVEHVIAVTQELLSAPDLRADHALSICQRLADTKDFIDAEQLAAFMRSAFPVIMASKDEALRQRRDRFLVDYALVVEGNREKALAYKRSSMPANWQADPNQLNSFAWWCHEQAINVDEAARLARKAVDLSTPGRAQANILDTLAELVNRQGRPQEALALIRQAIALNPESTYLQGQQQRFEELIAQQH